MITDRYYDDVKELRNQYMVAYSPPRPDGFPFACISVTLLGRMDHSTVEGVLRTELNYWLTKYPIAAMATAFDEAGDIVAFASEPRHHHLVGWTNGSKIEISSDIGEIDNHIHDSNINDIYTDISFVTRSSIIKNADEFAASIKRQNIVLKISMLIWLSVGPAAFAVVEFFGPEAIGAAVLCYSLWKSFAAAKKIFGTPQGASIDAEKQRQMRHYYYHCERNPAAFSRLRAENFSQDQRERTRSEAEALAKK